MRNQRILFGLRFCKLIPSHFSISGHRKSTFIYDFDAIKYISQGTAISFCSFCWEQQSSLTPFRDLYLLPHSVGVFTRVAKFLGSKKA